MISEIMRTLIRFSRKSPGRKLDIMILHPFAQINLKFTIRKRRK